MNRHLRRPNLGGVLTIVNGLLWVAWAVIARSEAIPSEAVVSVAMILSLPIALPFVLPPLDYQPSDADVVGVCIIIGLNSLAWGYGLAWLWQVVCGRSPFFVLLAVVTILAGVFGFFLLM